MTQSTQNYTKGLLWFIASLSISAINDALTKQLVHLNIHYWQVTAARLFFATITLYPYTILQPNHRFPTQNHHLHILRGILLIIALALWGYGIKTNSNTTATIISFTIPLFTCLLSVLFLQEKPTQRLIIGTFITFIGIAIILWPKEHHTLNTQTLALILAAILFAALDVLNKYIVDKQPIYSIILYTNIVGLAITLPIATYIAPLPAIRHFPLLILLGIGGNAIIFCLLKAYQNTTLISLAPVRYLELMISIPISILIFNKKPHHELYASLFIIPAVLFIIHQQQTTSAHPKN